MLRAKPDENSMNLPLLLVRMRALSKLVDCGESFLYEIQRPESKYFDPDFPRPISLSNSPRGAKAWRISDIEAWIKLRAEKSGTAARRENFRTRVVRYLLKPDQFAKLITGDLHKLLRRGKPLIILMAA